MKWLWTILGFVGIGALALAAGGAKREDPVGGNDIPPNDPWARPSNMLALASDPDQEGFAPETIDSDAVLLGSFAKSVAVSGWGFMADPQLQMQAYLVMREVAQVNPDVVFLLYQDLRLTEHGDDEISVMAGRFGARTIPDALLAANDIEGFRTALREAATSV